MKLIIEKINGSIYAYREREKHFRHVEPKRGTPLLDATVLDQECDLGRYDDFHIVIDVKKPKKAKKSKTRKCRASSR